MMEIWIDTADLNFFSENPVSAAAFGITTNPSILSANDTTPLETIAYLLKITEHLCIQVISNESEKIIQQARYLQRLSTRIIVKIPATENGFLATKRLVKEGVPVLLTAIENEYQALISCALDVDYIAPYFHQIKESNTHWQSTLERIKNTTQNAKKTKMMLASLRSMEDVDIAMQMNSDAITVPPSLYKKIMHTPQITTAALQKFSIDWQKIKDNLFERA